tara:strand:- start:53 stop:772 length:720 start_codon:yes stop_codon:yes gene_type:complete
MKINSNKWIKTLVVVNNENGAGDKYNSNPEKWIHTLPREKKINPIKNYSIITILFVCGLMFVSVIKNETRNLQKNINISQKLINNLKVDLHQETLDHEIITSPENLALLAEENLDLNFISYKKSQIKELEYEKAYIKKKNENNLKTSNKKSTIGLKENIVKKIEKKKVELAKLKEIYSNPKEIPDEIKTNLAKKIEMKKMEIYQLYKNPRESITIEKVQRWALFQVAKLFVGIPIIPGK